MARTRQEHLATMHRTRSPFTLGWEAARANALPALIIQTLMLMLLVAFLHKSSGVHASFATGRAKAYTRNFVCGHRIRGGGGAYSGIVLDSFLSSEDVPVVETFVICSLPYPFGGWTEHLSTFCIEAKQPGLETLQHCQSLQRKSASINLDTIPFSRHRLVY